MLVAAHVTLFAGHLVCKRRRMSALLGYARISTTDQDASLQHDALTAAGCDRIFSDTASGAHADRPELLRMLDYARAEDTIVVWRLDRLGRSLRNLVELVNDLAARQIDLRSLQENIDTATATGRLIFHVFGSLAEFERELIRERTKSRPGQRPSTRTCRRAESPPDRSPERHSPSKCSPPTNTASAT